MILLDSYVQYILTFVIAYLGIYIGTFFIQKVVDIFGY